MSVEELYRPPQAELSSNIQQLSPAFYVVSSRKFWWLMLMTMGLYQVFWFYQHWRNQRLTLKESTLPLMRALFSIFFTHSLFRRIQNSLDAQQLSFIWTPVAMATIYVVSTIVGAVLDQVDTATAGEGEFTLYFWISYALFIPTFWALFKAQQAANLACNDAHGEQNDTFTLANFVWMAIGVCLWSLVLFSLYLVYVDVPMWLVGYLE